MSKFKLFFMAAFICLATTAFGQAFSFKSAITADQQKNSPALLQPTPTVSPNDFQKQVQSLGQQNQAQLNQQAAKLISKQPGNALPPPLPPPQANKAATQNTDEEETAPPPKKAPQRPAPSTSDLETETNTAPQTAPPPSGSQNQPYTGFGAGGSSTTSPSQSNQGEGWSIKY